MGLALIAAVGLALAWLHRTADDPVPGEAEATDLADVVVPDDLWAAFHAVVEGRAPGAHPHDS